MENPEVLIALITAIGGGILTFFTARADRRSRVAEKKAQTAREELQVEKDRALQREEIAARSTQALIDNLTRELARQAKARETEDKAHRTQIAVMEDSFKSLERRLNEVVAENQQLKEQITGMERLYEDETQQWRNLAERWATERRDLLDQLELAIRKHEDALTTINLLEGRILLLESARDDGNTAIIAGESITE